MIANYNIALLRSLKGPLEEGLEGLRSRLAEGAYRVPSAHEAQGKTAAPDPVLEWSRQIKGNLQMVRCHAITRVAHTLDDAVRGLFEADRRGWTAGRSRQVAQAAAHLAGALGRHIGHMANEDPVLPVILWPLWSAVNDLIGGPLGRPEDLFEPDPQFGETVFRQVDADYLASVVDGALERLKDALVQWGAAKTPAAAERAARRVQEVFDSVYGLRHRRAYQVYWLAWRARLAVGMLEGGASLLDAKEAWTTDLHETDVELRKFGRGARAPQFQRLMHVLAPLVESPWPDVWSVGHPVLAEIDQCLNLSAFWATAEAVQSPEHQRFRDEYDQHRDELLRAVNGFSTACVQAFGNPTPTAFKTLQQAGLVLMGKEDWLPDARLAPLLGAVRRLTEGQGTGKPWSNPESAIELAGMVITMEEALDRPFPMAPALVDRIQAQLARLEVAWEGRLDAWALLPAIRWDAVYMQQKERQAVLKVLQVIRADIDEVETQWVEADRQGESASGGGVVALARHRLEVIARVLATLRRPAGTAVARALIGVLGDTRFVLLAPGARTRFVEGLAALSAHLEAVAQGQGEPAALLSPLLAWAGEELAEAVFAEQEGAGGDDGDDEGVPPGFVQEMPVAPAAGEDRVEDVFQDGLSHTDAFSEDLEGADDALGPNLPVAVEVSPVREAEAPTEGLDALDAWDVFSTEEVASEVIVSDDHPALPEIASAFGPEENDSVFPEDEGHPLSGPASFDADKGPAMAATPLRPVWLTQALQPLPSSDKMADHIEVGGVIDRPTDREIAKCFVDEATDIFAQMAAARGRLRAGGEDEEDWAVIRRGYHTLKGSGRMAGYVAFGEVAWWAEDALSNRIAACHPFDADCDQRLTHLEGRLSGWVKQFDQYARAQILAPGLQAEIAALFGGAGDPLEEGAAMGDVSSPDGGLSEEDRDWDEVFEALQGMIQHAQRLGQALVRVRGHRPE